MKFLFSSIVILLLLFTGIASSEEASPNLATAYLYADAQQLPETTGSLVVRFQKPKQNALLIAWGRKYRKDRHDRTGTKEENRNIFKPHKAKSNADGTEFRFEKLPPDFYDLLLVDLETMTITEGLAMLEDEEAEDGSRFKQSITEHLLGTRKDFPVKIWEGFFDTKQIDRLEASDVTVAILLQQERKGLAFAESGAKIEGCIHSIDVVWLEQAKKDAGWQVLTRQQLFREVLATQDFFVHKRNPAMSAIRIGTRKKTLFLP